MRRNTRQTTIKTLVRLSEDIWVKGEKKKRKKQKEEEKKEAETRNDKQNKPKLGTTRMIHSPLLFCFLFCLLLHSSFFLVFDCLLRLNWNLGMKHNQVIANAHFHKNWANHVQTWFDQPADKKRRRNARLAKAKRVAPRPISLLRPAVRCPTIKYNMRLRAGRGFTFAELKAAQVRLQPSTRGSTFSF